MSNRDLIVNALKNINPSDALTERVASMNFDEKKHVKIHKKRIIAAIIAVIVMLTMSITVCSATGILNFNSIFDKNAKVNDIEYGESLMSNVTDFSYEICDNRYEISLAGVSATVKRLMIAVDFTKTDGSNFKTGEIEEFFSASNYNVLINGEHVKYGISFSCDYSSENSFRQIYEMTIDELSDAVTPIEISYSDNYNAEDIIFRVNFNIVPTNSAVASKAYDGKGGSCEIYVDVTDNVLNVLDTFTVMVNLDNITADSSGIYISGGSYAIPEKYADSRHLNRSKSNSILCILNDGTEIPLGVAGGSARSNSPNNNSEWTIEHHDYYYLDPASGEAIYLDINDVAAFSVNGKVFSLN